MATKYFVLFTVLKSAGAKGVSPDACAKELNFAVGSVAPYMAALRIKFGAEIEAVKEGRTTKAYVLKNPKVVEGNITPNRRSKSGAAPKKPTVVAKTKKVKPVAKTKTVVEKTVKVKPTREKVVAPDADLMITEVTDSELADIKSQLGLA